MSVDARDPAREPGADARDPAREPGADAREPFSPRGPGLVERRVLVPAANVAWLRYVLEAHDGLAFMHSDGSGEVLLLAPVGLTAALDELVRDLLQEGCLTALVPDGVNTR